MSEMGYLNQIKQLVELQKVDDEIFEVRCALENAPRELEELRKRFEEVDHRRNLILDKLSHLNEQKKRLSFEIEDDSARIKKSKNKMMSVGNSREYQAMVREMDNMEKNSRSREEERATLLEELQRQEDALNDIEGLHAQLKNEMDRKSESLDQTVAASKDRLNVLDHQRLHAGEGIPRPIFRRYEFIRNRLEHPVIVPVEDAICSGCHIAVPPQTFIELQTGQQILSCPNCQRLIYWNEHFDFPEDMRNSAGSATKAQTRPVSPDECEEGEQQEAGDSLAAAENDGRNLAEPASAGVWPEDAMRTEPEPMKPEFEKTPAPSENGSSKDGEEGI